MDEFVVVLADESISETQLDSAVHDLREELLRLDIDTAHLGRTPAPDGTRGGELVEQGVLIVKAAVDSGLAQALAERLTGWLGRQSTGKLEIIVGTDKLVLDKATPEQQDKLVEHFLRVVPGDRPRS